MAKPVDYDPICDKDNPRRVTFEDISSALFRIRNGINKTPCVPSHMNPDLNMELYLKCEFLQYTGSFKERGARNALLQLSPEGKKKGVAAASLGNHSQGMSYHGVQLNIPTTVVMPLNAPIMKVQKCKKYGATVVQHGSNIAEAKLHALELCKEKGMTYINGYDHPAVIAGQGTCALEILDQLPEVQAILVPCGGGGLLAGVVVAIKHLRPDILVYGVETDKCASMAVSIEKGEIVNFPIQSTLADGLAVGTVGYNSFYNVKPLVDKMIVVTEEWAARAILRIVEQDKFVIEGGGSVGVAAIMAGMVPELKGKKVVAIATGGNIDSTLLGRCIERGLAAECRLVKFKVNLIDRPGSLSDLCKIVATTGACIKDITQERAWLRSDIFSVRVKVICEIRGVDHLSELREVISGAYSECFFPRDEGRLTSLTDSLIKINTVTKSTKS